VLALPSFFTVVKVGQVKGEKKRGGGVCEKEMPMQEIGPTIEIDTIPTARLEGQG
jgi:hypothetical protein